jgi:hypothetical protein
MVRQERVTCDCIQCSNRDLRDRKITLGARRKHRRHYGRNRSPLPPVTDHLVTVSRSQEDISDVMEDVRSVSPAADPEVTWPQASGLDDQEEDRFQDYDDDGSNGSELSSEEELSEESDDLFLASDGMGVDGERYLDEVEEMELERLEAFSSIIHCPNVC